MWGFVTHMQVGKHTQKQVNAKDTLSCKTELQYMELSLGQSKRHTSQS